MATLANPLVLSFENPGHRGRCPGVGNQGHPPNDPKKQFLLGCDRRASSRSISEACLSPDSLASQLHFFAAATFMNVRLPGRLVACHPETCPAPKR